MKLNDLSPVEGSKKAPFRKGQGHGSGNGKSLYPVYTPFSASTLT